MHTLTGIPDQPRRRRAARRAAFAALTTLALAVGTALVPSTAFAIDQGPVHLTGTVHGVGEIGLSNGRYTPSDSDSSAGATTVAAGATTDWWIVAPTPKMTFEYRIVERGAPTKYWIVGEGNVNSSDWAAASCSIWKEKPDGTRVKVDQETSSPYVCSSHAPGLAWITSPQVTFKVHSQDWATVRAVIEPQASQFDTIALSDGEFDSDNTDLVVNGATHTDASAPDEIAAGGATHASAYLRNAENGELTHKANLDFSYRIVEDGFPTAYWVVGFAENERASRFDHTSTCSISLGEPGAGGVTVAFSPYTCSMVGDNLSGRGDWQVTFKVGVHEYTRVEGLSANRLIKAGCTAADAQCAYVMSAREGYAQPSRVVGEMSNGTDEAEAEMKWEYEEGRSETNSIDTSVTLEASTEFWVGEFKTSFKIAYGHEWEFDKSKKWTYKSSVPPHTTVFFHLSPAYERITGDYFFKYQGKYYRAVDATFDLPLQTGGPGEMVTTQAPYNG